MNEFCNHSPSLQVYIYRGVELEAIKLSLTFLCLWYELNEAQQRCTTVEVVADRQ